MEAVPQGQPPKIRDHQFQVKELPSLDKESDQTQPIGLVPALLVVEELVTAMVNSKILLQIPILVA